MNIFNKYDHNLTYLVAVSGGPDSMALLDMLYNDNFKLVVALINYKKRKESDYEEEFVKKYCLAKNIEFKSTNYVDDGSKKTFQVKAREFRYKFFSQIYHEKKLSGLFVAHHKNDLVETYLLKKQRNVINYSVIIEETTVLYKMEVYRPLLHLKKIELLDYCNKNSVPYSIDSSNELTIYTRNKIRQELKNQDVEKIYEEALAFQKEVLGQREEVRAYIKQHPQVKISEITGKNDVFLQMLLYEMVDAKYKKLVTKSLTLKLKQFIKSTKPNLTHLLKDDYYLVKEYDLVKFKRMVEDTFSYQIDVLKEFSTSHFKTAFIGTKMQGIKIFEEDFPLTIRNFSPADKILLKDGTYKRINRLFIDKKIGKEERKRIPVIVNKNNDVLLIVELYRKYDRKDFQNNFFVVK